MKFFILFFLFIASLLAYEAEFGIIDGEVYILRHGKLIKAFHGLKIDEYDTIYSKSFSKSKIIFKNNVILDLNGKQTISVKSFMDKNKILRLKTTKEIQREKTEYVRPKKDMYKRNSKFYKQLQKREHRDLQEKMEKLYIDKERNIYLHSETEGINNISDGESSSINVGTMNVDVKSNVESIVIKGKSSYLNNVATGHGARSRVEVGNINVK